MHFPKNFLSVSDKILQVACKQFDGNCQQDNTEKFSEYVDTSLTEQFLYPSRRS